MVAGRDGVERGELAALIRQLREGRGLTQESLAERSGVSIRAIQDLESGRRRSPQFYTLKRLADALSATDVERDALTAAARSHPNAESGAATLTPLLVEETVTTGGVQPSSKGNSRRGWRRPALVAGAAAAVSALLLWLVFPFLNFQPRVAASPSAAASPTASSAETGMPTLVKVLSPVDQAVIPGDVRVHGTASLPSGTELWLLLQPQHGDSSYFSTTPKPIRVDASGAWTARIRVGRGPRDGGYRFRLFAVVSPVDGGVQRHVKLLPPGEKYPKMAEVPRDCVSADQIEVSLAS